MWKVLFQTEHQIAFTSTPLICVPRPSGPPAGCCCFLRHLCWHGGPAALRPESAALPSKQEEHTALWWTLETQKHTRGTRQQAEEDDNISAGAQPLSLRMESSRGGDSVPAVWAHGMLRFLLTSDGYPFRWTRFYPKCKIPSAHLTSPVLRHKTRH